VLTLRTQVPAPDAKTPDGARTMDVVTALSWMMTRMLTSLENPQAFVDAFVTELLEVDVPQLEAEKTMPRLQIDPQLIEAMVELDFDADDLRAAEASDELVSFATREVSIAEFMLELDDPDLFDKLRSDDPD
jgi:hypothetical protein